MNIYQKLLGHPWVYERLRPWVVGGIDMSPAYRLLELDENATVLDVGCGTGDALRYVSNFKQYLGLDTDFRAVEVARSRFASPRVRFECRQACEDDFGDTGPTHVSMVGLLHHLPNAEAIKLLQQVARASKLKRAVTLDIVYLEGQAWNNLLAFLDRGRYCRTPDGYRDLARAAGMRLLDSSVVRCHPEGGRVQYFVMALERPDS